MKKNVKKMLKYFPFRLCSFMFKIMAIMAEGKQNKSTDKICYFLGIKIFFCLYRQCLIRYTLNEADGRSHACFILVLYPKFSILHSTQTDSNQIEAF